MSADDLGYSAHSLRQAVKKDPAPTKPPPLPSVTQVGGDHYKKYKIQPLEYIVANNMGFCAASAIKYITRYRDKGGSQDIRKAIHFLQLLLEHEYQETL